LFLLFGDKEYSCIARPQGRARIETDALPELSPLRHASPGLKAGRGLKLISGGRSVQLTPASPGLKAGRGLKRRISKKTGEVLWASPGLKAGRGLKLDDAR